MSLKKDLDKFLPRKEQLNIINHIDKFHKNNSDNKFYLMNLPPGVGKSHLALMIIDWYKSNISNTAKFDIITNSKLLQDQYTATYESIMDMKGKENYECSQYTCSCAQGMVFNSLNKTTCDKCPYTNARNLFISGDISLTNFHLYLIHCVYNNTIKIRGSNVLIIDECHEFDDVMSNFISVDITEASLKKYSLTNEKKVISELSTIENAEDFINFLDMLMIELQSDIAKLDSHISSLSNTEVKTKRKLKISKIINESNADIKNIKLLNDLKSYNSKIEVIIKDYETKKLNWIFEKKIDNRTKQLSISLEPIWMSDYINRHILSQYDKVFMMSATILDKNLFCTINGIDVNKAAYLSIPSPFELKNRMVYYMPVGRMTYKNKEETFKNYIPYIQKILKKYSDKKGIIHTNSFELSNWIRDNIKDERLIFHTSLDKDEKLKLHIDSKEPTVIVSPSMDTGVSFDNDFARFQIIAKVPYPSLQSKRNSIRNKENSHWYSWKTAAVIQQSCGRIVRSNVDYGDTIILDESFGDLLRYDSNLFPKWFQDSIKTIYPK
jgi:ATP-dependent DNA helicase DinG